MDVDHVPSEAVPVTRASMIQNWDGLTFLHWRYEPAVVQAVLPPGLTIQTFDGSAWVGLVPFHMRVRLPRGPVIPWISHFPETNVRTYVTGPDGTTGIWFLSLDAARLSAVVVARLGYRLPYMWSAMSGIRAGDVVSYQCRRRWPAPRGATSTVAVRIGKAIALDEVRPIDTFLTSRWRLFSMHRRGPSRVLAHHRPWPLQRGELLHLSDDLVAAGGLPPPVGEPYVHFAEGVEVRIGWPARATRLGATPGR